MKKSDLLKLKPMDRVLVSGNQDGTKFSEEVGTVLQCPAELHVVGGIVLIAFDDWDGGHGDADREWYFYGSSAKDFTITKVEAVKADPMPAKTKKKTPKGAQAYKGNGKHIWELVIPKDHIGDTWRLRVPGGWLYNCGIAQGVTFVPVPNAVGYAV